MARACNSPRRRVSETVGAVLSDALGLAAVVVLALVPLVLG